MRATSLLQASRILGRLILLISLILLCVSDSSQALGCFTDVTRRRVDPLVGSAYRCFATPKRLFFGINKESACYLKHLML